MSTQVNFTQFIENVYKCDCKDCILHGYLNKSIKPIQLPHSNPKDVRVVIITEQPKILKNQPVTNENFSQYIRKSSTFDGLEKILGQEFLNSIKNRTGPFYWTHHTKCPNIKRLPQNKCANKYLKTELAQFCNLKLVVSFGSKSFNYISQHIIQDKNQPKLLDYFYELLVTHIKSNHVDKYSFEINDKNISYLSLPHPSPANPLKELNIKIKSSITASINNAIKST